MIKTQSVLYTPAVIYFIYDDVLCALYSEQSAQYIFVVYKIARNI